MNRVMMSLAGVVVVLAARPAQAQFRPQSPVPLQRPAVSPYLNLFQSRNPGIDYYGIVQPLEQLQGFEQRQLALQGAATQTGATRAVPGATGTSARFMAYGGYFNVVGGQRVGSPVPPPGYTTPIVPAPIGRR